MRRPLDAVSRAAYVEAFAAWRTDLARAWRDAGAAYATVTSDEAPERAVRRIVRGEDERSAQSAAPAYAGGRELA